MKWIWEGIEAAETECKGCMSSWPPRQFLRVSPWLEALLRKDGHCKIACRVEREDMRRGKEGKKQDSFEANGS